MPKKKPGNRKLIVEKAAIPVMDGGLLLVRQKAPRFVINHSKIGDFCR